MNDDNSGVSLTRRRLLGGLTTIGVAGAASGAGTWAYFSDTEESTGNTVEAGTLDLDVSGAFGDGDISGTWTISNAIPGEDSAVGVVNLRNAGSVEADHIEFDFSVEETESAGSSGTDEADTKPDSADGMADQFEVEYMKYKYGTSNRDVLNDLSDANGNGFVDLGDLVSGNDETLDDFALPTDSKAASLMLDFQWADDSEFDNAVSGTNNDYQGDEFELTVTCSLHQDSSQDLDSSQDS